MWRRATSEERRAAGPGWAGLDQPAGDAENPKPVSPGDQTRPETSDDGANGASGDQDAPTQAAEAESMVEGEPRGFEWGMTGR